MSHMLVSLGSVIAEKPSSSEALQFIIVGFLVVLVTLILLAVITQIIGSAFIKYEKAKAEIEILKKQAEPAAVSTQAVPAAGAQPVTPEMVAAMAAAVHYAGPGARVVSVSQQ